MTTAVRRLLFLPYDLGYGFHSNIPLCCVLQFSVWSLLGGFRCKWEVLKPRSDPHLDRQKRTHYRLCHRCYQKRVKGKKDFPALHKCEAPQQLGCVAWKAYFWTVLEIANWR